MRTVNDSPFTPEVEIELGGKMYTLTYPIPAVWVLEDLGPYDFIGGGIAEEFANMTPRQKMKLIVDSCYAGLTTKHPDLTHAQVAAMIFPRNIRYVEEKTTEAFNAARPVSNPKVEDEADPLAQKGSQPSGSPESTSGPELVTTSASATPSSAG
jgi:hypothetical protein